MNILIVDGSHSMPTSMRLGVIGAVKLSQSMTGIELPSRIPKGKGQRKNNKQDRWK
jgi:hypothetical protein